MPCNKIVWAFVGLCGLSLFLEISEAAPKGGKSGKSGSGAGNFEELINNFPPDQLKQFIDQMENKDLGDMVKDFPDKSVALAFKGIGGGNAAAIGTLIKKINVAQIESALNTISEKKLKNAIKGLGEKNIEAIFGVAGSEIEKETKAQIMERIVNLPAVNLGSLVFAAPNDIVANLIKGFNSAVLGEVIKTFDETELKRLVTAVSKS
ncbi:hypothetical protein JTE90_015461 [Oedothorax gibbosus]|uniref:Uncharacterized protein n=1 Tax=Oedothorax gibbosus TaxID=931172 RepID=A0AAV6UC65_9ARAC|nr:hypothetical protein JTE90_015461 [Oedothorax gibbosus]